MKSVVPYRYCSRSQARDGNGLTNLLMLDTSRHFSFQGLLLQLSCSKIADGGT